MKPGVCIDPAAPLPAEFLRLGEAEIDAAIASLHLARTDPDDGFHECRKSLKKLRALVGLVASADPRTCRRLGIAFRDVARALSGPREAAALVETVDRIGRDGALDLAPVRMRLAARRDETANGFGRDAETIRLAIRDLGDARATLRLCGLPMGRKEAARVLKTGVAKRLRKAGKALKRAKKHGEPHDFHDLRKAVKAHWMHVTLLAGVWPGNAKKRLKRLDALGERLGELNDDQVMLAHLDAEPAMSEGDVEERFRASLKHDAKAIGKRCIEEATRLLDKRPGKLGGKVASRYRKAG